MKSEPAEIIGLRIDPNTEEADWYALWYSNDDGDTRFATTDGRLRLAPTFDDAWRLSTTDPTLLLELRSGLTSVCDLAGAFYAVAHRVDGDESLVLLALNLLDDFLLSIDFTPALPNAAVLDRVVVLLTEGNSLADTIDAVGGPELIVEPMLGSIGRLFTWARFEGAPAASTLTDSNREQ